MPEQPRQSNQAIEEGQSESVRAGIGGCGGNDQLEVCSGREVAEGGWWKGKRGMDGMARVSVFLVLCVFPPCPCPDGGGSIQQ